VRFTNLSENYTSSYWSFGDGESSTATNPTHTYRNVGTYTARLTVRGPGGEDTASQTITVQYPAGVLYEDDFNDPNSGWPVEDWRRYEDGEYSIFMEKAGYWGGSTIPGEKFFDAFCVEIEARKVGRPEGAYGIVFGFKDWDNNYSFAISTDGWYLIDRMVEGNWILRARWTKSAAVKKGTATNRLKILVDTGHNMKFYVNDQLVRTMLAEVTYEGGEIGIYAWAFDDGFRANFDYIRVLKPERCTQ
jgi:PKD repeat protein